MLIDHLAQNVGRCGALDLDVRRRRLLIGDEVLERCRVVIRDALVERGRRQRRGAQLQDSRLVDIEQISQFARRWSPLPFLHEALLGSLELVQLLGGVHGSPDHIRGVGDGTGDRLTDPPGRIGGEFVPAPVVELLDRAHQPGVALLDQVQHCQAVAAVLLGYCHHKTQIRRQHAMFGCVTGSLDLAESPPDSAQQRLVFGQARCECCWLDVAVWPESAERCQGDVERAWLHDRRHDREADQRSLRLVRRHPERHCDSSHALRVKLAIDHGPEPMIANDFRQGTLGELIADFARQPAQHRFQRSKLQDQVRPDQEECLARAVATTGQAEFVSQSVQPAGALNLGAQFLLVLALQQRELADPAKVLAHRVITVGDALASLRLRSRAQGRLRRRAKQLTEYGIVRRIELKVPARGKNPVAAKVGRPFAVGYATPVLGGDQAAGRTHLVDVAERRLRDRGALSRSSSAGRIGHLRPPFVGGNSRRSSHPLRNGYKPTTTLRFSARKCSLGMRGTRWTEVVSTDKLWRAAHDGGPHPNCAHVVT